ncbi:MAG: hypothetical protein ABI419_12300 [Ginsengibacter sp.]
MYSAASSDTFQVLFLLLFIVLAFVPFIFFLITLQKTMNVISVENRKMPPSNVWLMLIPLFNIVWQFIMVSKIAESVTEECIKLNIQTKESKPTYNSGLTWNICNLIAFIPIIGGLAALVTFILYWVKVNEYKNLMIANKDNYMLDAEKNIFYGDKA